MKRQETNKKERLDESDQLEGQMTIFDFLDTEPELGLPMGISRELIATVLDGQDPKRVSLGKIMRLFRISSVQAQQVKDYLAGQEEKNN